MGKVISKMKNTFIYRVSKYAIDDIPRELLKADWVSSSLFVGLRLEDLKSPIDAQEAGFNKVSEMTFIRESDEDIGDSVNDMCSLFISTYIFQSERDNIFYFNEKSREIDKNIRDLIVGPLNQLKRKKGIIEITACDDFYTQISRIFMLDSMELMVLVLDKEAKN